MVNHAWRALLTLFLAGIFASPARGAPEDPLEKRVYLFRGIAGYWPNADGMAGWMVSRGYTPQIYCSRDVRRLTSVLIQEHDQGTSGPIEVIGYSYGASAAVRLARNLMAQGICVDRMVLIECYDYPEIPPNVRYCVNLYETRRMDSLTLFRGTPARADASSTTLIDIDISCAPGWEDLRANNHFTMADDPRVQEFVAQQFPGTSEESSPLPAGELEPFAPAPAYGQPLGAPSVQPWSPDPINSAPYPGPLNSTPPYSAPLSSARYPGPINSARAYSAAYSAQPNSAQPQPAPFNPASSSRATPSYGAPPAYAAPRMSPYASYRTPTVR